MKRVCAALLVLIMALTVSLTGCSGSGEPDTTLEAILEEMETAFALDASSRMSEDDLLDFYGIQSADISEQASLSAMNGLFPDEIIMIKAKDETALARIQEKLANRLGQITRLAGGTTEFFEYLDAGKCDAVLTDTAALYYYNSH